MKTPFYFSTLFCAILSLAASSHSAGQASKSMTVEGQVLDIPSRFADGSARFHLAPGSAASSGDVVVVPAGGKVVPRRLLLETFESAKRTSWRDDEGTTTTDGGVLTASSARNLTVLSETKLSDVTVAVDLDAEAMGGVLGRYLDERNFILAFYSPKQKTIGFHEVVNGDFGPWIASAKTDALNGKRIHLVVDVNGHSGTVTATDELAHTATATANFPRLTAAGSVGLYHDNAAMARSQRFDNFTVTVGENVVPADCVQVIIPKAIADENFLWRMADMVKVTGVGGAAEMVRGALRSITIARAEDIQPVERTSAARKLFPTRLPDKEWVRFNAEACASPVGGVIHRLEDTVTCGMALGGIDTGCIDLETSGLLGYCTLFNTHVPRRGPINLPILGLSTGGRTWVLCDKQPKQGWGGAQVPVEPVFTDLKLEGVETVKQIHYFGHYPVADLEFETDAPVSVGLRAWSPFLPGDVVGSMLPGTVFEVHLRNTTDTRRKGTIAFSFPGPSRKEAGSEQFAHKTVKGAFNGSVTEGRLASYALGIIGKEKLRLGGELGASGAAWAGIAEALPPTSNNEPGSSAAVDFDLSPGKEKIVRFVLTWYAPTWNGGGYNWANWTNEFTHMYAKHYPDLVQTANVLAKEHESLLKRILAWQQVIYTDPKTPTWLQDSLINSLYLITETGMWAQKKDPLPGWVRESDGLFGMNECPRGCPQIECIPCSFYGNIPLVYFFPDLALSTLRGYKGYQYPDGCPPWTFTGFNGGKVEFADPSRGYQWASDGISFASLVHRFLMCHDTPDKKYLKEFYPSIKKCMEWTLKLRTGDSYTIGMKVIAMPDLDSPEVLKPPTEWFEAPSPGWFGMTAHIGGLHLAQLRITEAMAREVGDMEFARQCEDWLRAGQEAMEKYLWDPRGYYLNFYDTDTDKKSEFVFGYQMDGEWITDHHGLPSALSPERVKTVLETVKRCNIAVTKYGAVNYANPDGTVANPGGYGTYSYFPPEALMLAMNYMYEGQKEFGVELARKVWNNLLCLQGYTWDMPNIMRGDVDTGERTFGNDYYQDMMLWSLPAAMDGQDLSAPTKRGELVDRILKAAKGK